MKYFLQLLSFGLLATASSALPLLDERQTAVYSLTVSTTSSTALNGQTVEIVNSVLGVYPGNQPAATFYPIPNQTKPGRSSLHTYPVGIVDHVLGLKGSDGLYSLVDVTNIGQSGAAAFYDGFILRNNLVSHEIPGNWVAFPVGNGWQIKRYDGNAIVTQDYVPVNLVYKLVNKY
ncbi:hypothetical protein PFICI_15284 [Pestalotiopsis fici W106-1]|uniref:Uncharacterized protein n=1 Tax=Pestalotiopsis fici (strain W106-1 / CGMCC3.15140) TaxID=1229662 RepID=W3WH36_PESFW|nr:uncharacterized protein PFICI_15284 [Pestalotiopsis fici W106-1]ETS73109.1 hypothetical protein PFICI_15284 [Pestalotiopsis fici W106-1]